MVRRPEAVARHFEEATIQKTVVTQSLTEDPERNTENWPDDASFDFHDGHLNILSADEPGFDSVYLSSSSVHLHGQVVTLAKWCLSICDRCPAVVELLRVTLMTLILSVNEDSVDLAHLLERVRQGEEIIIAESGQPVARLVPIAESGAPRVPGSAAGQIVIADDFDAPLPEPVLGAFEQ